MSDPFDPYHRWLGIPPSEQPPNHYRLLGLELFESDREVIDSVAMRHITYLQDITDGPHVKEAQRLLNELAAARRCLLDADRKAVYDERLRAKPTEQGKPPKAGKPPTAAASPPEKPRAKPPVAKVTVTPPPKVQNKAATSGRTTAADVATESRQPAPETRKPRTHATKPRRVHLMLGSSAGVILAAAATVAIIIGGGKRQDPAVDSESRPEWSVNDILTESTQPPTETTGHPVPLASSQPEANPLPAVEVETDAAAEVPVEPMAVMEPSVDARTSTVEDHGVSIPAEGLLLWLDAAEASSLDLDRDGRVRQWTDRSGNGSDATADRADERPLLVPETLDGKPVVRFSGSQRLGAGKESTFDMKSDFTFVFVSRGQQGTLLSKGRGDRDGQCSLTEAGTVLWTGGEQHPVAGRDATDFAVCSVTASGGSVAWFVNGQPAGSDDASACHIDTSYRFRIGCPTISGGGLQDGFIGDLAELLVYDATLETAAREELERHLQEKWLSGVAPPSPIEIAAGDDTPIENGVDAALSDVSADPRPKPAETEPQIAAAPNDPPSDDPDSTQEEPAEPAAEPKQDEKIRLYINVGGDDFTDPNSGIKWLKCPGEGFDSEGGRRASEPEAPNPVMGSAERGLNAFRAEVPNGVYDVQLFFCDNWSSDPTSRVFNIAAEQKPVRINFSVFMVAGGRGKPAVVPIPKVAVNDGRLDIDFEARAGTVILNGISIQQR